MILQLTSFSTFKLEGDVDDTFLLLFEALEIASTSDDVYAPEFGALAEKFAAALEG